MMYSLLMIRFLIILVSLFSSVSLAFAGSDADSFTFRIKEIQFSLNESKELPKFKHTAALHKIDPQGRVMWLSSEVPIPRPGLPLAIYLGAAASSEVYWNGTLIATNGRIGYNKESEQPGLMDATFFIPPNLVREGKNTLSLRLSSHHNLISLSQPIHYLRIATPDLAKPPLTGRYLASIMTVGAFILATLYFGILAIGRKENPYALFIAAMAFFASTQLLFEALREITRYSYPWHTWRLVFITASAAGFALSMTTYISKRFNPKQWTRAPLISIGLLALTIYFLPGFDSKALFCLLIPIVVSIVSIFPNTIRLKHRELTTASILSLYALLILIQGPNFLDQTFYLATAAILLLAFVDQARELKRVATARRTAQERADTLELELLKRRIAPHFLMNTLNALIEWVESQPSVAVKMINALANEFRLFATMSNQAFVTLSDEISICRYHLTVMSYRSDQTFELETENIQSTLKIPPGIVHTLIENAFTHSRFHDGATFRLAQSNDGQVTTLSLHSPPPIQIKRNAGFSGEGSAYIQKRLLAAFGKSSELSHKQTKHGSWSSTLRFKTQSA
ncbi:histidine kinase [Puniceicoccaceae bacterium K14]|nr:histidine kinase [Puniceicoccaceae bacterium K14]